MPEPIDLADARRNYDQLVRRRKALEHFAPVDSRPLTEIDKQLAEHPLLKPKMEFAIRWRSIYLLWLKYQDAHVPLRHAILLTLRELHRAMPTHYQEEFGELWWRWLDNFEEEEVASGERAESDRRYVWTPSAAAKLRGCDA